VGAPDGIPRSKGEGAIHGERALAIVIRTAHISAMAILVGGYYFAALDPSLRLWKILTAATGLALLLSETSHSRHWVYQARGVITLAHVGALALIPLSGVAGRSALVAALVIGSIGSHLPRSVRKWSFRHGRIVD
jgi:hypothetical protein